jgi:hypothetical protein
MYSRNQGSYSHQSCCLCKVLKEPVSGLDLPIVSCVAGKSTLAASLQALLQAQPYGLNVAVVSLDGQFIFLPSPPYRSHPDLALLRSNTVSWHRDQISI